MNGAIEKMCIFNGKLTMVRDTANGQGYY